MLTSLFSTLGAKIAAGTLIAATAAGGAAAVTGNLPAEAQNAVANVAEHVNIELPRPEGHGGDVTDAVFEGDPSDGEEFGANVADVADEYRQDDGSESEDAESDASDVADPYRP